MKTIDKEVAFLMKFKKRFKIKADFLTAVRDMVDEGLIKESSYQAMNRLAKHLYRKSKKRKEKTPTIGSEKTPTIGSGCEGPSSWRHC